MNSLVIFIPITETPSMVSTNSYKFSQNESLDDISFAIKIPGDHQPLFRQFGYFRPL